MGAAWLVVGGVAAVAAVAACGDNRAVPDARRALDAARLPTDAPPALVIDAPAAAPVDAYKHPDAGPTPGPPDLQLVSSKMDHTLVITEDTFTAADCEVAEACVGGTGLRRLLRFDAVIANLGIGDLVMGEPPPPGVSNDVFQWSACHMHHHVNGFAGYALSDASGTVVTGRKNAFCLMDSERIVPGAPTDAYTCDFQGISVGWADLYSRYLPCQWLDITDVPSGTYTLTVTVNPNGLIEETDTTNNTWSRSVTF